MHDMKRTKAQQEANAPQLSEAPKEEYPHGLRIRIQKEELVKLGFKNLPKVGDEFMVEGHAVVHGVSASEGTSGDYKEAELQLTHLELESDEEEQKEEKGSAEKIYGGK